MGAAPSADAYGVATSPAMRGGGGVPDADTIYALASGAGRAGVAVLRLSGAAAGAALTTLTDRPLPEPRRATLRRLLDPVSGETLDRALVLWLPTPGSYTGENVVELHVHGGRAVIAGVVEALGRIAGLRPAEPGEFTRRAFVAGRLDLTAAEGLDDLIAADTPAQRRLALRQMDGVLAGLYDDWRARLLRSLAWLEAAIDFPDEELPADLFQSVWPEIRALREEIAGRLADARRGERVREGFRVAIMGPPNAGKSSLLNALAGRDAAIVAATAGTTRDVIEVELELGGFRVILADTAGLREAAEDIEAEGVRRALARAEDADLRLVVATAESWPDLDPALAPVLERDCLLFWNKCDLRPVDPTGGALAGSALTGAGVAELLDTFRVHVEERLGGAAPVAVTRARHRRALDDCIAALDRAEAADLPELMAEDVRLAARALGRVTGRIDVEELLDAVFRDFCIGK